MRSAGVERHQPVERPIVHRELDDDPSGGVPAEDVHLMEQAAEQQTGLGTWRQWQGHDRHGARFRIGLTESPLPMSWQLRDRERLSSRLVRLFLVLPAIMGAMAWSDIGRRLIRELVFRS
jgi:hypothetical protein